jgi:cytochrome c-type biogenesis protein CcmF
MIPQLGYTALLIALFAGSYAFLVDALGIWRRDDRLSASARNATIISFICLSLAGSILMTALIKGDFAIMYVADHTATDLPLAYRISAFWAGASGSLLLWLWLQVGFMIIVFCKFSKAHNTFSAAARAMGNLVSIFFLLVLILDKNPFDVSLLTPEDGNGLNPLLQHPAMALHPPALFIGYAAFMIPFVWAFALLKDKNTLEATPFITQVRRWILWAWMFLTIGIVLGAWWAYEELGWGGYWAWDPVENSSLLPWLTATALLHCSRTYKRNTSIATWLIVLSILTFSLCIFGTFLTRYGLVSSVHAFPEPGLGILFIVLLIHIWVIAISLIIRAVIAKRINTQPPPFAGHRYIAWNNWLLIILTVVILIGTLFPFLSGLVSSRPISLKPEYFTKISAPGGLALLLLLAICPYLLRHGFGKNTRAIGAIIVAVAALACWWFTKSLALPCLVLCAFACLNLVANFITRFLAKSKNKKTAPAAPVNLRWYGARIVHLGIILAFMGIAGSGGYGVEEKVALKPNESTTIDEFTFTHHGLKADHGPNFTAVTADISVTRNASDSPQPFAELSPSMAVYSRSGKRTSEVDIKRTFGGDVYLALEGINSSDQLINLNILIKPLINWIWIGGFLTIIGSLLVQISLYRQRKTATTTESEVAV